MIVSLKIAIDSKFSLLTKFFNHCEKQHFADYVERDMVVVVHRRPCGGATSGAERAS